MHENAEVKCQQQKRSVFYSEMVKGTGLDGLGL